ncbi:MAG: hypothetical protein RLZZ293_334 [Pseudomonadota bacterium]|jgi:outer membrane protein
MKKFKLVILGLSLTSSLALAEDFQLGYVNMDRIFAEAKPALVIQKALKDKYAPQQTQLQTLNTNISNEQKQMQDIASKADSFDKLTKADQTKLKNLQTQLQKNQTSFQQQYVGFQQNLQNSQELALSMLMNKTNVILKDLSDKNGYDFVVTSTQMVYAKAKYDITDQVMAQLNNVDVSDIIKDINNPAAALSKAANSK